MPQSCSQYLTDLNALAAALIKEEKIMPQTKETKAEIARLEAAIAAAWDAYARCLRTRPNPL